MKGASPLIAALLLIGLVVGLSSLLLIWNSKVSDSFKGSIENMTDSKIKKTEVELAITNVATDGISVKNKGKSIIHIDTLAFYIDDEKKSYSSTNPAAVTSISPGDTVIFTFAGYDATDPLSSHKVKVTGPYGAMDEYP